MISNGVREFLPVLPRSKEERSRRPKPLSPIFRARDSVRHQSPIVADSPPREKSPSLATGMYGILFGAPVG